PEAKRSCSAPRRSTRSLANEPEPPEPPVASPPAPVASPPAPVASPPAPVASPPAPPVASPPVPESEPPALDVAAKLGFARQLLAMQFLLSQSSFFVQYDPLAPSLP